jgi:hypothetical protein
MNDLEKLILKALQERDEDESEEIVRRELRKIMEETKSERSRK